MWTSTDGQKFGQTDEDVIVAGTATKLAFCSDSTNGYSDDATIVYAFTDALIIRSVDQYGNLSDVGSTEPTVKLSVTTGSGAFCTAQDTSNPYTNTALSGGSLNGDVIYYRPTSAGTHTLKAETVGSPSLTSATWTVYVAPAVVLKDANNQTIGTYGPTSTSTTDATYGGAWIQAAIDAAFPGDTVELGGSSDAPAIYELSTVITLSKKITLTSANGASYTTLRPTTDAIDAVKVTTDGTATNPIIIDDLTFTRLRSGVEFDQGVYNNGYDYLTVRNCVFDYILPANASDHEYGAVVGIILHPQENADANTITSATISNNTFTNCCPFAAPSASEAAVINIMTKASAASGESITGVTISDNTLTNCNGININISGYAGVGGIGDNESYVTANVTDNTITNPVIGIDVQRQTHSVKILRNTVAGAYCAALYVESCASADHDSLVIKNNTFTGAAGASKKWFSTSGAVVLEADGGTATTDVNTVQFNDIYDNDATYSIYVTSGIGAQDCQYNYYGDATGPYYSALAGATITTSNTSGTGKKVTDLVTYYPWLYKSRADVVTDNANYCAQRISLPVGIHTLSTPALLIPTADTIAELMPDYATNMEYCYKYDDGIWSNIGTDTLTPCHAYYIKMKVADSVLLQYDADEYYTPSWLLDEGWNLIGLANLSSKAEKDAVASVLLDSAGLPGYSQVISPSMNTSSWSYSSGADSANSMLVGEGYWIYMQNDATLAGFTIFPLVPDLT